MRGCDTICQLGPGGLPNSPRQCMFWESRIKYTSLLSPNHHWVTLTIMEETGMACPFDMVNDIAIFLAGALRVQYSFR
jgi:hypothetical protein